MSKDNSSFQKSLASIIRTAVNMDKEFDEMVEVKKEKGVEVVVKKEKEEEVVVKEEYLGEQRMEIDEEDGDVWEACYECGKWDEEEALVCDFEECWRNCHLTCTFPVYSSPPEGEWFCDQHVQVGDVFFFFSLSLFLILSCSVNSRLAI